MSKVRTFYYKYGVELSSNGDQLRGDCPFCRKSGHFEVYGGEKQTKDKSPGMFNCWVCGESGNVYGFIKTLLERSTPKELPPDYYHKLAYNRGLLPTTFHHCGFVRSAITGEWLFPAYNQKKALANLYTATKVKKGREVKYEISSGASPLTQQLYRINTVTKETKTVYITEGHWDTLVLIETLACLAKRGNQHLLLKEPNYESPLLKETAVLGLPGVNIWKPQWGFVFKNRDVVLCFDNDEPGHKGRTKLCGVIQATDHKPSSLRILNWRSGDPNDLRDLLLS